MPTPCKWVHKVIGGKGNRHTPLINQMKLRQNDSREANIAPFVAIAVDWRLGSDLAAGQCNDASIHTGMRYIQTMKLFIPLFCLFAHAHDVMFSIWLGFSGESCLAGFFYFC